MCETCSDAISHTKHKTYDCFLVDIMLPDGDGISLAKTLRSMSDMPIIMTTAK
ncbi:response regulator [bacterium]|nr:response regulator [bacterium]